MPTPRTRPGPGQESVWDYPRPPRLEPTNSHLRVEVAGTTVAHTSAGFRVLETSHPPVYYFPPDSVDFRCLLPAGGQSFCEWKGIASYFTLVVGERQIESAAWTYRDPTDAFAALKDHIAFYPSKVDACFVDDEQVSAQPGDFYGGWITSKIVGPFKGGPGTFGW